MADEIETKTTEEVEEKETPKEAKITPDQIAQAVQGMLDEGYTEEEILQEINQAIEDGEIPETALEIAQRLIEEDSEKAKGLFGIKD